METRFKRRSSSPFSSGLFTLILLILILICIPHLVLTDNYLDPIFGSITPVDSSDTSADGRTKDSSREKGSSGSGNKSAASGPAAAPGSGPYFAEEPSDAYSVGRKPAILNCVALNALKAWFNCNAGDEMYIQSRQTGHDYVDPQTGVRNIEVQLRIDGKDIEEHAIGNPVPFQCWCLAYGSHQEIKSRKATVQISSLYDSNFGVGFNGTAGIDHFGAEVVDPLVAPEVDRSHHSPHLKAPYDPHAPIPSAGSSDRKSVGPLFMEEPTDVFVVRNKPAILRCKVQAVAKAWFDCNAGDEAVLQARQTRRTSVDPHTGVRQIEVQLKLLKKDVEEFSMKFGHVPFECWCTVVGTQPITNPVTGIQVTPEHHSKRVIVQFAFSDLLHNPVTPGYPSSGHDSQGIDNQASLSSSDRQSNGNNHHKSESANPDDQSIILIVALIVSLVFVASFIAFVFVIVRRTSSSRIKGGSHVGDEIVSHSLVAHRFAPAGHSNRGEEDAHQMLLLVQQPSDQLPRRLLTHQNTTGQELVAAAAAAGGAQDKVQLITRLNNGNIVDHLVVRNANHAGQNQQHHLVELVPSPDHRGALNSMTPKSSGSGTTTGSTGTTLTGSEDDNHSEPDYAEPVLEPSESSRSSSINKRNKSRYNSAPFSPTRQPHPTPRKALPKVPAPLDPEVKIPINQQLITTGCLSWNERMGMGVYIPPDAIQLPTQDVDNDEDGSDSDSDMDENERRLKNNQVNCYYGVDLDSKCPSITSLSAICVFGVHGMEPLKLEERLRRPVVLIFQHCLVLNQSGSNSSSALKIPNGLSILWQRPSAQGSGATSSSGADNGGPWIEILRYGEEDLNTSCYAEFDKNYVYLMVNYTGKFMLAKRKSPQEQNSAMCNNQDRLHNNSKMASSPRHHDLMMNIQPHGRKSNHYAVSASIGGGGTSSSAAISNQDKIPVVKQLNFTLSTEQISSQETLLRVFVYDNLHANLLQLERDQVDGDPQTGDKNTVFTLVETGGNLCVEVIKPSSDRHVRGMRRIEIPSTHVWQSGPNTLIHCSFVISDAPCSSSMAMSMTSPFHHPAVHHDQYNHHALNSPLVRSRCDAKYQAQVWQIAASDSLDGVSDHRADHWLSTMNLCQNLILTYRENYHPKRPNPAMVNKSKTLLLYGDRDINMRSAVTEHLDAPRNDFKDWRGLATIAGSLCGGNRKKNALQFHYVPYFASQTSPTSHLLDLWEAKLLCDLINDPTCGPKNYELHAVNKFISKRLTEVFQLIQRDDVIAMLNCGGGGKAIASAYDHQAQFSHHRRNYNLHDLKIQ